MMKRMALTVLAVTLAAHTAAANDIVRKDLQVMNDIAKQVNRYAYFTIFDDVSAAIDEHGVVTLTGKVTMPYKRDEIGKRVARVDGVREVRNELDVLPVSQWDDDLRYRIARAIYGNPSFWQYATMVDPPIHIVVDRGHVRLTGVVTSEVDRMIARSLATTFGAFSVTNELKTNAEMRAAAERTD